jgi:hypothetical protein
MRKIRKKQGKPKGKRVLMRIKSKKMKLKGYYRKISFDNKKAMNKNPSLCTLFCTCSAVFLLLTPVAEN